MEREAKRYTGKTEQRAHARMYAHMYRNSERGKEAARSWLIANREKKNEQTKRRYRESIELRAMRSAYHKWYRQTAEGRKRVREANYRSRHAEKNQAKIRTAAAQYAHSEAGRLARRKAILRRYDLTFETFQQLVVLQNNACAVCENDFGPFEAVPHEKLYHIDHDHATGKIRGVLCHNCNAGLGAFRDSQERLLKGISYLKRVRTQANATCS